MQLVKYWKVFSAEELRAEHPCGALYAGLRQLSEAETRALTHYLHEQRTPLFTFIAFKEGDVLVSLISINANNITRRRRINKRLIDIKKSYLTSKRNLLFVCVNGFLILVIFNAPIVWKLIINDYFQTFIYVHHLSTNGSKWRRSVTGRFVSIFAY